MRRSDRLQMGVRDVEGITDRLGGEGRRIVVVVVNIEEVEVSHTQLCTVKDVLPAQNIGGVVMELRGRQKRERKATPRQTKEPTIQGCIWKSQTTGAQFTLMLSRNI